MVDNVYCWIKKLSEKEREEYEIVFCSILS